MPKTARPLDVGTLARLFDYDPETGKLFSFTANRNVGRIDRQGYVSVDVVEDGRRRTIFAHRIAVCLMTGADIPANQFVDHINRAKGDNRWGNLRMVSHRQNMINSSQPRTRHSGLPSGVYANVKSSIKPYKAKIQLNGKPKYLGSFATIDEAMAAADAARTEAWNVSNP